MDEQGYGRAQDCGSMWLNQMFVVKSHRSRLWRTQIRLSIVDIIFILFFWIIFGAMLFGAAKVILIVPGMDRLVSPYLGAVLGIVPAWFFGRRVSHVSPYRLRTGEGIGSYLYVKADSKSFLLGRLIGRRVAVNKCVTRVSGKRAVVSCVEWLGTARAPMMPRFDPDALVPDAYGEMVHPPMEVMLVPRCKPLGYIERYHRDQAAATTGLGSAFAVDAS